MFVQFEWNFLSNVSFFFVFFIRWSYQSVVRICHTGSVVKVTKTKDLPRKVRNQLSTVMMKEIRYSGVILNRFYSFLYQ